jgi:HK97 family phage portal protein
MANKLITDIKNLMQRRLFGFGPTEDWSYIDNFQGPPKDVKLLGMYSGIAYRCIDTIATAIGGSYSPYFFTVDSTGKKTTIPNHPLAALLGAPNPDVSQFELFEGSATFVEQFGEFFWYMVPGALSGYGSGVKEIYLMRPDRMGIVVEKGTGDVIGYNYTSGMSGKKIPFTVEEIMHYMTFNPKNPYRGYATLEAAAEYVLTEEEVSRFTRNYFRNNAAMSGIISVEGKTSRDNWNKFVRQWRERYQGVDNAGKVALVRDSQIKFTPISSSISDMQLKDLKESTIEQILLMFRVPKGLLGLESGEGLGRASVETLEYIFAKWTIDPKLSRLDDLLLKVQRKYYSKFTNLIEHISIIPTDKIYQLQVWNQGVDRWLTRNEIRSQDPLTANVEIPGDDQLFTLTTQVPLISAEDQAAKDAAAAKAQADALAAAQAAAEAAKPKDDGDGSDSESAAEDKTDKSIVRIVSKKKDKSLIVKKENKESFRLHLEKTSDEYARKYKEAMLTVLKKQEAHVQSKTKHLTGKALADDLIDMAKEDAAFMEAITPVLEYLAMDQGVEAMEFSGGEGSDFVLSKSLIAALEKSTKKMAKNFNDETVSQLSEGLADALNNGATASEISALVGSIYGEAKGYRTERVARTESIGASNAATRDAYQQNPIVTSMQWFANSDACPFCAELDGKEVGLTESFVSQGDSVDTTDSQGNDISYQADYGDVETPPLHPNCACTIVPITE